MVQYLLMASSPIPASVVLQIIFTNSVSSKVSPCLGVASINDIVLPCEHIICWLRQWCFRFRGILQIYKKKMFTLRRVKEVGVPSRCNLCTYAKVMDWALTTRSYLCESHVKRTNQHTFCVHSFLSPDYVEQLSLLVPWGECVFRSDATFEPW